MTHETGLAVSRELAAAGISHTVHIGIHENMAPRVSVHVEVALMALRTLGLGEGVKLLEEIASHHGLLLGSSLLSNGISFVEPKLGHGLT